MMYSLISVMWRRSPVTFTPEAKAWVERKKSQIENFIWTYIDFVIPGPYAEIDKTTVGPFPLYIAALAIVAWSNYTLRRHLFFYHPWAKKVVCPAFGSVYRCELNIDRNHWGGVAIRTVLLAHYLVMNIGTRFSRLALARFHSIEVVVLVFLIRHFTDLHVETTRWKREVGSSGRYVRRMVTNHGLVWILLSLAGGMHLIEAGRYYYEYKIERKMIAEREEREKELVLTRRTQ
mmetsp:Transcript_19372/g.30276  ORF Transcript_19372/g.30276 Transcript_19372/m.30276 type:complete len:233 (+) Transcript_19372:1330-2028(+)